MASEELDGLWELHEPDAVIQSANQAPIEGVAAIRSFWKTTFDSHRIELVPEILELTELGEVAIVRGRAAGRLVARAGGNPITVDSWFMQAYRRAQMGRGTSGMEPTGPVPRRGEAALNRLSGPLTCRRPSP